MNYEKTFWQTFNFTNYKHPSTRKYEAFVTKSRMLVESNYIQRVLQVLSDIQTDNKDYPDKIFVTNYNGNPYHVKGFYRNKYIKMYINMYKVKSEKM